jgi:hypothetical protein
VSKEVVARRPACLEAAVLLPSWRRVGCRQALMGKGGEGLLGHYKRRAQQPADMRAHGGRASGYHTPQHSRATRAVGACEVRRGTWQRPCPPTCACSGAPGSAATKATHTGPPRAPAQLLARLSRGTCSAVQGTRLPAACTLRAPAAGEPACRAHQVLPVEVALPHIHNSLNHVPTRRLLAEGRARVLHGGGSAAELGSCDGRRGLLRTRGSRGRPGRGRLRPLRGISPQTCRRPRPRSGRQLTHR